MRVELVDRVLPLFCHSEERSDEESTLVAATKGVDPSLRSG
jgi:hypothetical protein